MGKLGFSVRRRRERLHAWRHLWRTVSRSNLPVIAALLTVVLISGGVLIIFAEDGRGPFSNFFNVIWYGVVSMTTTGYGDIYPATTMGRVIAMGIIVAGVTLTSMLTASVSSLFVAAKIKESEGLEPIRYHQHIIICGWSHITRSLLDTLMASRELTKSHVVLVADIPGALAEDQLVRYESLSLKYVRGDWTHDDVLRRANVQEASIVVILPDESLDPIKADEKSLLATLATRALNTKARLVVHIQRQENRAFLLHAQASEVTAADELAGPILASQIAGAGVLQVLREMFAPEGANRLTIQMVPSEFVGKPFSALADHVFRRGGIIIGLVRQESPLEAADLLSADTSALDEFIRAKLQEAGLGDAERARTRVRLNPPREAPVDSRDLALVIGDLA